MRKSIFLILGFSFIMFLFACNNETENNQSDKTDCVETDSVKNDVVEDDKPINEDFSNFYDKFVSDENFQLERVKFPVKGSKITGYDQEEQWSKDNWTILNNIEDVDTDKFTVEKNETDTKVEHKIYIPGTGFSESYTFELIDGKWYLTERNFTSL